MKVRGTVRSHALHSFLLVPAFCASLAVAFVQGPATVRPSSAAFARIPFNAPRRHSITPSSTVRHGASNDISGTDTVADRNTTIGNDRATKLKMQVLELAETTRRGFVATRQQRKQMQTLVDQLQSLNPTAEPASPYYDVPTQTLAPTLAGKWTLVYTDAPDITGLDTSRNPFAAAKLGRIGQECMPPTIKNIIEWKRPHIAERLNLPFSGNADSRVLQKVVISGKATPDNPLTVNLDIVGLELQSATAPTAASLTETNSTGNPWSAVQSAGIPAGLLQYNGPLELKGVLTLPFGKFEILYLDDELRIIRTNQNYLAINTRIRNKADEWF